MLLSFPAHSTSSRNIKPVPGGKVDPPKAIAIPAVC
jgi:hypothetical protein